MKKVWVEMELPEGDYLACLESAQKTFHAHMAGTFLNGPAIIGKNDSYQYKEQVKAAVGYLSGIFAEFETCCDYESGFRSLESCSFCTQKIHDFRTFMEANGFIGIEVENLEVSTYFDTTGSIRAYTSATAELAGDTININNDVIGFLNRMDNAMDGIYGSLYYYDPMEDVICKQILEVVSADYSLPVAIQQGGVTRSSPEEVVMDITTILTVDEDGGEMVHMRIDIIEQDVVGNEIYLVALGNIEYDISSVKDSIEKFFYYCGEVNGKCFQNGIIVPCPQYIYPQIFIPTGKLSVNLIKDLDKSLILMGEPSKIAKSITEEYLNLIHPNRHTVFSYDRIYQMSKNPLHPEQNINRYLSIVDGDFTEKMLSNYNSEGNKAHLAAFLSFHALGHAAGISHYEYKKQRAGCNSFMSAGHCLTRGYFGKATQVAPWTANAFNCTNCWEKESPIGEPFNCLNTFVQETMKLEKHYWIKVELYNRFSLN